MAPWSAAFILLHSMTTTAHIQDNSEINNKKKKKTTDFI